LFVCLLAKTRPIQPIFTNFSRKSVVHGLRKKRLDIGDDPVHRVRTRVIVRVRVTVVLAEV